MVHHAQGRRPQAVSGDESLFRQPCRFVLAAHAPDQFPDTPLPEVAFMGRSNAGKSSLINALTRQKNLARSSKTPGRTQQIIFFNAADRLSIADLPGYGHAKAPKKIIAAWHETMRYYLLARANLRCVALLIDSRHGLLANDHAILDELDRAAVSTQLILAKADYLNAADLVNRQQETMEALRRHPSARPDVMTVSAKKGTGLEALRTWLASFAAA